jgi:hypothetical protein
MLTNIADFYFLPTEEVHEIATASDQGTERARAGPSQRGFDQPKDAHSQTLE